MTRENRTNCIIYFLLALAVVLVYAPVLTYPFINCDDTQYVLENANVTAGLTWHSLTWAVTAINEANWHPLTWLSHMLDVEIFGLNPSGHHLVNVLLHTANTLLLYLFLSRTTQARWPSAFVAALFALHPLNVESVAWVAERKNVLSTFFFMATLLAYARYARKPRASGYLLTVVVFALGLMSKPMLVTLPCLLLLLDFWPLCRWQKTRTSRLVLEKLPLLLLSAGTIWLAYIAQNTVALNLPLPLGNKLANALVAYGAYLWRMVWPVELAFLYPFVAANPAWKVAVAGVLLLVISISVLRTRKNFPYLTVGWFWYLGTLLPVIGLVRIGFHATADRYTYVPLVGIFILIAWGAADFAGNNRKRQKAIGVSVVALLACLATTTRWQLCFWRSNIDLFSRTVSVTADNYITWYNLGNSYHLAGLESDAIHAYETSLAIKPNKAPPHNNIGYILAHQGKFAEAIVHYKTALSLQPDFSDASRNLGVALLRQGDLQGAVQQIAKSVHVVLDSDDLVTCFALGLGLVREGRYTEAMARFDTAIETDPGHTMDYSRLGSELIRLGRVQN